MAGFNFSNVGFIGSLTLIGPSSPVIGPTPGFSLHLPGIAPYQQNLVSGLSTATAITVCALISKPDSATNIYLTYCFDEPGNTGLKTDLIYAGPSYVKYYGSGMNTYTSAFTTANNRDIYAGGGFVLITAVFYPGQQTKDPLAASSANDPAQFKLYVQGVRQPLTTIDPPHAARTFSNNFFTGGDSGSSGTGSGSLVWPGQIKELYLYTYDLSDLDRQRTETYLNSLP